VEETEANIARGGEAWQPENVSTEIRAYTWNTSNANTRENSSHAERQYMNWILNSEQREIMLRIRGIEIQNISRSPCSTCSGQLATMLTTIKREQRGAGQVYLEEAHLYWTTLHARRNVPSPTLPENITVLRRAGWTLHAPQDALPIRGIAEEPTVREVPGVLEYEPAFDPRALVIHPEPSRG